MWVFGYGSLLWNPGFEYREKTLATLDGWHRSFCMRSIHHRGTEEQPGLVLADGEILAIVLGAAGSLITRPEIAARALLAGGTPAQQEKWLTPLAAGKELCAISITEPNTGSDVAAVSLKATRTDGGWLLNGAKSWCTFAGKAQLLFVKPYLGKYQCFQM